MEITEVFSDTNYDAFQQPFTSGEKEILFYTKDTNPSINPSRINIKCQMYQNAIMNPKISKLGQIFNLNIELIHEKITSILIIIGLLLIMVGFYFICLKISIRRQNTSIRWLILILIIGGFILVIAMFILLYKVIAIFYKSDMIQFIEFMNCKNVNRDGFGNYLYAENLYGHFIWFVIMIFLHIIVNVVPSQNNKNEQS